YRTGALACRPIWPPPRLAGRRPLRLRPPAKPRAAADRRAADGRWRDRTAPRDGTTATPARSEAQSGMQVLGGLWIRGNHLDVAVDNHVRSLVRPRELNMRRPRLPPGRARPESRCEVAGRGHTYPSPGPDRA